MSPWLPRSLVGRVFALYTVTLVGFVAAGLALFYAYRFNFELEEAQERAEALGAVILPMVSDSAVIGDYDTILRTLQHAVLRSSFASASYIDLRGGIVRAPHDEPPQAEPPRWLRDAVAARLYDNNHTVAVGGRDYGVLRLSFAPDRIAGQLWQQTRIALALGVISVIGGLVLIRFPLVRWLGNLGRIQAFEKAMRDGDATPDMLVVADAPTEFRKTFEVLGMAARSLQSQRAQAAVTLGAIADGVFTLDPAGRVVLANPAACEMAGMALDRLIGRDVQGLMPMLFPASVEPYGTAGSAILHEPAQEAAGTAALAALSPWTARRVTLDTPQQDEKVLDTTLSPILAPDGGIAGHVLACRDVSRQHELDQRLRAELRTREAALVALRRVLEGLTPASSSMLSATGDLEAISTMISELVARLQERGEQLDAIFALSPDGFVSFDAARRANYVSPAFARLTGIAAAQVLGVDEERLDAMLRDRCASNLPWAGMDALRLRLMQQAEDGSRQRHVIELERPRRRMLEVGLREGTTDAISQVLSLRDVTHETAVDRMKSEFLCTAAHELRTPMASIYGFAELLTMRELTPERQAEMLTIIHRQSELMIAIINQLLDLARIEARRGADFAFEPVDLTQWLPQAIADFVPPIGRDPPQQRQGLDSAAVQIDPAKLQQAVTNVLSNAYKYSPNGGDVCVQLRLDDATQQAGIEVRDFGIGMSDEQMARVCERFYRADASGSIPGSGLGMSIVKEIVELLGGQLQLASAPGKGTTVTLWLPLIAVGQTDDPPAAAQQMLPGNPSAGSPSCAGAAALPVPA